MDARIFCKQRPEEGHRETRCFVLPFFFLFPFFFPVYWFHIVKMVQDGSGNGQTMRLELPTQHGHAYVPKHSTGPRMGPRAAARCQDAGPPQDLGPPPGCPSPAPSQQLAVSCLSPLDDFSRRIHILFAEFDLAFRNFSALPRPTGTPWAKTRISYPKGNFVSKCCSLEVKARLPCTSLQMCFSSPFPSLLFSFTAAIEVRSWNKPLWSQLQWFFCC